MKRQKTLFLGTPSFSIPFLETLLKDNFFKVVGIVTQPSSPSSFSKGKRSKVRLNAVEKFIEQNSLAQKVLVLKPKCLSQEDVKDKILSLKVDLILIVAFGQILKSDFLDLFPQRVFNIHASLLPRWRGAAPIQRALLAGDKETGVCLQLVDVRLDRGPILGERKVLIQEAMDSRILHDKLSQVGTSLIENELKQYLRGELKPLDQNEWIKKGRKASYAHKLKKEEFYIKWRESSLMIASQVRALALHSGAIALRDGKVLKIHKVRHFLLEKGLNYEEGRAEKGLLDLFKKMDQALPGEILKVKKDSFYVACGEGFLQVMEVQPESRSKMKVSEYLRGYALEVGDRLESQL